MDSQEEWRRKRAIERYQRGRKFSLYAWALVEQRDGFTNGWSVFTLAMHNGFATGPKGPNTLLLKPARI